MIDPHKYNFHTILLSVFVTRQQEGTTRFPNISQIPLTKSGMPLDACGFQVPLTLCCHAVVLTCGVLVASPCLVFAEPKTNCTFNNIELKLAITLNPYRKFVIE